MLLEPAELETLERLAIATRSRLLGHSAGGHRSRRFGSSLDFADHREYRPGDDFRRIDAALSARMDRLFLKMFEAEEDVPVRIVVDASASMAFGSPDKSRYAATVAAALAHVTLIGSDRVRIYLARDDGATPSRWFRGKADSSAASAWLESQRAGGTSGIATAVRRIHEEGRAGLLVLIGDLLEEGWEQTVRRLAPPGEATVLHVLAPQELNPGIEGDLTLVDAETGREIEVTASAETLDAYRARLDGWLADVRSACTSRGTGYALLRTDEPVVDVFVRRLPREQVLR